MPSAAAQGYDRHPAAGGGGGGGNKRGGAGIKQHIQQAGKPIFQNPNYFFLWFRKNSRIQKTSRGRSLVPCNAAGGILEYTDYVKV